MVILTLLVLGLCLGSFINASVWRIHEQDKPKSKLSKSKRPNQLSIINGRSICETCGHELKWYDLIPIISWASLNGKCRYCHKPISMQNPAVETVTAALFVISYVYWPTTLTGGGLLDFVTWLIVLAGLIGLLIYDYKWTILPNRIIYPLLALTTISLIIQATYYQGGQTQLINAFWGVLAGGGLFYVLFQLSGGRWIGGGDVKLGALLGLVVGDAGKSLLFILIASLIGSLIAVPLLMFHKIKATTKLPFGPLLIIGGVIAKIFGAAIINWYTRKFLFI